MLSRCWLNALNTLTLSFDSPRLSFIGNVGRFILTFLVLSELCLTGGAEGLLEVEFPPGLSFRTVVALPLSRSRLLLCDDVDLFRLGVRHCVRNLLALISNSRNWDFACCS